MPWPGEGGAENGHLQNEDEEIERRKEVDQVCCQGLKGRLVEEGLVGERAGDCVLDERWLLLERRDINSVLGAHI